MPRADRSAGWEAVAQEFIRDSHRSTVGVALVYGVRTLGEAMPVTARLSKAFYDKLGEQVANELVEWFNQVDLTYRTELRELNELNFARFDAKVGERLAELRSELQRDTKSSIISWAIDAAVPGAR
jgi:hypothetical protein